MDVRCVVKSTDAMRDVWGEGDHVQCIHPGSACVATSDHVAESWKVILGGDGGSFAISLEDVRVTASDSFGVVTCTSTHTHTHTHTTNTCPYYRRTRAVHEYVYSCFERVLTRIR